MALQIQGFDDEWDIPGAVNFIQRRRCKTIAVQFPDELLKHAVTVIRCLQSQCSDLELPTMVYLLADTSYNSLGVDEVAAAHINADAMIHYGRASFSPLSRLPTYFVLGMVDLDISGCARSIAEYAAAPLNPEGMKALLIFLDQPLLWAINKLREAVKQVQAGSGSKGLAVHFADVIGREREPVQHCKSKDKKHANESTNQERVMNLEEPIDSVHNLGGYSWQFPAETASSECVWLWIGQEGTQAQLQLQLTFHDQEWAMFEPTEGRWQDGIPLEITRSLKKRYYLVEKAKNAKIIGILVGTLGAAGYKDAIEQIRKLAHAAGKKTYTLLMGKPNPAKLANFPEVEIFVHISDPQGHILNSKEYYAPIITPYEAQLAFSPGAEWGKEYRLDFESLLHIPSDDQQAQQGLEPRFSLMDSQHHKEHAANKPQGESKALSLTDARELAQIGDHQKHLAEVQSAAGFLKLRRTFQGLEAPVVGATPKEPEIAGLGMSGRAAQYKQESKES